AGVNGRGECKRNCDWTERGGARGHLRGRRRSTAAAHAGARLVMLAGGAVRVAGAMMANVRRNRLETLVRRTRVRGLTTRYRVRERERQSQRDQPEPMCSPAHHLIKILWPGVTRP